MLALLVAIEPVSSNSRAIASDCRDSASASLNSRRRSRMSARLIRTSPTLTLDPALRAIASASVIAESSRAGLSRNSMAADSAMRAFTMAAALPASSANL